MEDLYNNILQDEQAIDAKRLQKFLQKFKKPELQPSWMFKGLMKKRLHKIIQEHKRQQEASILASIPSFAKWRFGLTGFAVAVCGFLFIFLLSFFTDFFWKQIVVPSKYVNVAAFPLPEKPASNWMLTKQIVLEPAVMEMVLEMVWRGETETSTNYLYDGKKYPKVAREMPVYKRGEILTNHNFINQQLAQLNFGGFSLKTFGLGVLKHLTFATEHLTGYLISLDIENAWIDISEIRNGPQWVSVDERELPPLKQSKKTIEQQLKQWKNFLQWYGEVVLTEGWCAPCTLFVFIPQLLYGYSVWNPLTDEQVGVYGHYTIWKQQLSLNAVDIAKYEYVNYPTVSKEEILKDFTLGVKELNAPEIVYLMKNIDGEVYYVPWLRFVVDEETAVYKELVEF